MYTYVHTECIHDIATHFFMHVYIQSYTQDIYADIQLYTQ